MGASLDSREVHLPGAVLGPDSVRLDGGPPKELIWPAVQAGLLALALLVPVQPRGTVVLGILAGGLLPLVVWSIVAVRPLLDARTTPLTVRHSRGLARLAVTIAVAVPVLIAAAAVIVRPTGRGLPLVAFAVLLTVAYFGWVGGWLLRLARVADPTTPVGAVPSLRNLPALPKSVDFGEDGLRFPTCLPWVLGVTTAALFMAVAVAFDNTRDLRDIAWVVALGVGGGAWLPFLDRAVGRGLRPAHIQFLGWAYVVGAVAAVALFTANAWRDLLGPFIGMVAVLFAIVPGTRLVRLGTALAKATPATPDPA